MASPRYVDRGYLIIDGTEVECSEISASLTKEGKEAVATMNRKNRRRGFTGGVPMAEITAKVPRPDGGMELNFKKMLLDDDTFACTIEYSNGDIDQFRNCNIFGVDESLTGGKVETDLKITALDISAD